jgi:hypothetical protein
MTLIGTTLLFVHNNRKVDFILISVLLSFISCKGEVMPIHIFNMRLVVFLKENIDVFREFVHFLSPWIDKVADGRHYVHVQLGTQAQLKGDPGLLPGEPPGPLIYAIQAS